MQRKTKVSASQFFLMMFVSRAVVTIALNAQFTGGENLLDSIVSCVGAMLLGFLMVLPVWILHRKYSYLNVNDVAKLSMGGLGKAVPVFYLLYFIWSNAAVFALFEIFLMDTINPDFSSVWVILSIGAVALYGAIKGLEAVSRCAVCIFVVLMLGMILVFGSAISRFQTENLEPLFQNGFHQTLVSTVLFVARASVFADMAVLLPMVKGRSGAGFSLWNLGAAAFLGGLLFLLSGCLGRYAYTQNFPVYVLSSLSEIQSLQRVDAVFVGIWMMGIIIRAACDIYACRVCCSVLGKGKSQRISAAAVCLLMLGLGFLTVRSGPVQRAVLHTGGQFFATVAAGFLIPLIVLLCDSFGQRRKLHEEK